MKTKTQISPLRKIAGVALVFLALAWTAAAQTSPTLEATNAVPGGRKMSLQDCIEEALKHNLDIQIERYNPEIDLYTLRGSYSYYDPMFTFSGTHNYNVQPSGFTDQGIQLPSQTTKNDSFESSLGGVLPLTGLQYTFSGSINQQYFLSVTNPPNSGGSIGVKLTQPLLKNFWTDQSREEIKINKNQLQKDEQGFRNQLITTITAVETAYYDLIYQLELVKVQQEALDLSQTQLDQDQQRVQIGTLAQLSVQQDQSQVAQNKANLIQTESKVAGDEVSLKSLLTDRYGDWQKIQIQPTEILAAPLVLFDLQDSWNKALRMRPDLIQAQLDVEKQGIQLKFYRNQLFPELDVIGTYGYNGEGVYYNGTFNQIDKGNAPYYSIGAALTVPLANQSARNQYKSGKATLQQVVLTLKKKEQSIMSQVDSDIATAESDYQNVQATRQARVYAEAALDAEQKTYTVGKATTFEVLQYQSTLTTARGNEIQALASYEEALVTLSADEGSTLDKLGINIEAN